MNENYYVDTSYSLSKTNGLIGTILNMKLFIIIIIVVTSILMIISLWKIYKKAGKPGWTSIVPIYNFMVMCEIANKKWWYIFLMFIPIVNIYIILVLYNGIAKKFEKNDGFVVGMILLPAIFFPILAFGKSRISTTYLSNNEPNVLSSNIALNKEVNQNFDINSAKQEQEKVKKTTTIENNIDINHSNKLDHLNASTNVTNNINLSANGQIKQTFSSDQDTFFKTGSDSFQSNNNVKSQLDNLIKSDDKQEISHLSNSQSNIPNESIGQENLAFQNTDLLKNEPSSIANEAEESSMTSNLENNNKTINTEETLDIEDLSINN